MKTGIETPPLYPGGVLRFDGLMIHIRPERPADIPAIHALTDVAFAPMPYGDGTEAHSIDLMRKDGDLLASLVATKEDVVLGHIAFSPMQSIGGTQTNWVGLGPISVDPAHQHTGIGSALIHAGLAQMRAAGYPGCALIGNPAYYSRFGFVAPGTISYRDLPSALVQALPFDTDIPSGELVFAPGLEA